LPYLLGLFGLAAHELKSGTGTQGNLTMQRDEIQKLAKEKGHCLCSKLFSCPCRYFQDKNVCHCAGEGTHDFQEWIDYNTK
jgi:hypothetical protein